MKDSKRRLSLCSSEESEAEEPEYNESDDILPVLSEYSQLLDDHHLERVSCNKQLDHFQEDFYSSQQQISYDKL